MYGAGGDTLLGLCSCNATGGFSGETSSGKVDSAVAMLSSVEAYIVVRMMGFERPSLSRSEYAEFLARTDKVLLGDPVLLARPLSLPMVSLSFVKGRDWLPWTTAGAGNV